MELQERNFGVILLKILFTQKSNTVLIREEHFLTWKRRKIQMKLKISLHQHNIYMLPPLEQK